MIQGGAPLKNETIEGKGKAQRGQATLGQRQSFRQQAFQDGKALYDKGQIAAAVNEWSKLEPYFDPKSPASKLLESVKKNQTESLEAKKTAVEAAAEENRGLQVTYKDQMTRM